MGQSRLAAHLLTFLASGGSLERAVTEFPSFKAEIESAFGWMQVNAQCTAEEIGRRASLLGDSLRRKEQAIRDGDIDRLLAIREEECALAKSLGLKAKGESWCGTLSLDYQTKRLSALLQNIPPLQG